ncbi:MAG TPA: hypothetical protein VMR89_01735 [Actinomycetota bacterium]|nr:hypothetical protein [Actinomycetota bacterium]
MKARLLSLGVAMALAFGLLTAAPATATYAVASITFPDASAEFYSPFSGPASIMFTFDGSENNATFNARLRPAGGTAIYTRDVFVTPDEPSGFEIEEFSWPALSVSSAKTYVVAVYRNGTQVASESFFLRPRLVTITGASPNPFLPWIDDGYKDTQNVNFKLSADADAEARVYRPRTDGKCCGALVLSDNTGISNLSAGAHTWNWDGQGEGTYAGNLPKGDYFVKMVATDLAAVTKVSKPHKVTIARTYRKLDTREKNGAAYHHTGSVTVYERGGNCFVSKLGDPYYDLYVICTNAKFKVYWRWALPKGGRIEKVAFVFLETSAPCNAKKGHTTTDSSMTVGGSGQFRCRVDRAKITFSVPVAS